MGALRRRRPRGSVVSARPALDGIRVVEAATLFAAPLAGMFLGDYGADVIKIEHPRRPTRRAGTGRARTATGSGSRRSAATSGSSRSTSRSPPGATSSSASPSAPTSCSRTSAPARSSAGASGPDELAAREPAARARAGQRLRPDRPVRRAPRVRHARRGDERLRGAQRRAGRPAAAAAARPRRRRRRARDRVRDHGRAARARADRARPGRRHVADRAAADAARPAAHGVRPARRAAAAHRQPLGHNAPRNVYRTADGSWVAVSASATSIAERVLRLVGRPDLVERAVVRDRRRPRRARGRDRRRRRRLDRGAPRDEVLAAFEAAEAAIAPVYDARDIARRPAARGDRRDRLGRRRRARADQDAERDQPPLRHARARSAPPGGAHGADTDAVLAELGLDAGRARAAARARASS